MPITGTQISRRLDHRPIGKPPVDVAGMKRILDGDRVDLNQLRQSSPHQRIFGLPIELSKRLQQVQMRVVGLGADRTYIT